MPLKLNHFLQNHSLLPYVEIIPNVHVILYLPTHLPTYLPTYLPTHLPTYLPTYSLIYPLIYPPTYPPTHNVLSHGKPGNWGIRVCRFGGNWCRGGKVTSEEHGPEPEPGNILPYLFFPVT